MPLNREVLKKFRNPTFVETGTYNGDCVAMALELGFGCVKTIEIDQRLAAIAFNRFLNDPCVETFLGDSGDMLPAILPELKGPITFWLDAHPVGALRLFDPNVPLLRELLAIRRTRGIVKGDIILIDDMRLFSLADRITLGGALSDMWRTAEIAFVDGIETNDVAVCLVE